MTVPATPRVAGPFLGNGVATAFPFTFKVFATSDIAVEHTDALGAVTALVLDTDYSVTLNPDQGSNPGGTLNYPLSGSPLPTGESLAFGGALPYDQPYTPAPGGKFSPENVGNAFDRATIQIQQLVADALRSLRVPLGETTLVLPSREARKSRALTCDENGEIVAVVPQPGDALALYTDLLAQAASKGAGMVGYYSELAYPEDTVGGKLRRIRTFLDAGAVGDGVTDDTVAVQYAITHYGGGVIDGCGRTFRCDAPIAGFVSGTEIINATFDFSAMPAQPGIDKCFAVEGSAGAPVALTGNLAVDAVVVTVGDTSTFEAEKWVRLASTAVWAAVDTTLYGQYVKVKSVDSPTQLTLYDGPIVAFLTADSATIAPVTMIERVRFRNVKIKGAQANGQMGVWFDYSLDCGDDGCVIEDIDYAGIVVAHSVNYRGNATVKRARMAGVAYGYMIIHGSYGCGVMGGYGEDLRHYVTVGGTEGINIFCKANYNAVYAARAAGIDSHAASYGFECIGNQITLAYGFGDEGIVLQGLHAKAVNNHVYGVTGIGIYFQPFITNGLLNKGTARGNHVHFGANLPGTIIGIYAINNPANGCDWDGCDIDGNFFHGGYNSSGLFHVYVNSNKASGTIKNVNIRGNVSVDVSGSESIMVRTLGASATVNTVLISGNIARTAGARPMRIIADAVGSSVSEVVIAGNVFKAGTTANVTLDGGLGSLATIVESDNLYSGAPLKFEIAGTVTGVRLRSAADTPMVTTSTTPVTLSAEADSYANNRGAGTTVYTLPSAAMYPGRRLRLRNLVAQLLNSASANVIPLAGGAAGTALLAATAGRWCVVESDGTNWQIVQAG